MEWMWMVCLVAATSCGSCDIHGCRIFLPVLVVATKRLSALFVVVDLRREMMTCLVEKTMGMTIFVVVVVATVRWSTCVVVEIERSETRVFLPK